jgi:hypothetical protein
MAAAGFLHDPSGEGVGVEGVDKRASEGAK